MCGLVMEVCMLIFGIIALVRGNFTLTRNKVVTGAPARIIGVILILPLPLALLAGLLIGVYFGMQGRRPQDIQSIAIPVELGIILGCMLLAVVIGLATGHPPQRRRVPDDLDEEYDRRFREDDYAGGERPDPDGLRPPEDRIRE